MAGTAEAQQHSRRPNIIEPSELMSEKSLILLLLLMFICFQVVWPNLQIASHTNSPTAATATWNEFWGPNPMSGNNILETINKTLMNTN